MERIIDAKIARFSDNKTVKSIVRKLKEKYREAIHDRAAKARAEGQNQYPRNRSAKHASLCVWHKLLG
jgi:hypothetical protein